ncbi:MAG TPA: J domain-containing protein, partial [Anaeromyxobacter sp.]|nr:J domain-containing protein [Anaeromyxobacter sp.]
FGALCAAVRVLDVSAVQRRLGERGLGAASRIVGRIKPEDLRLTPQEARALGFFDGARSADEIAAAQPGDAGVVLRLALLLGELDLLSFGPPRTSRPAPAAPPPAAAPPAPRPPAAAAPPPPAAAAASVPPPPSAPPAARAPSTQAAPPPKAAAPRSATPARPAPPARPPAPAPAARPPAPPAPPAPTPSLDAASLQAVLEKQKDADHYQVLGVKRDSPAAAVKAAYFQMARVYHPDAVPGDAAPAVRQLCADVFARISEAWAVLSDDARRAEYLEELKSGGAADVDVMKILHAENLFEEATALVKARRYDAALAKLTEAIQLNADEAEFGMWKAWCEFLLATDKKRQQGVSASSIEAALKKNPRCAPGYLFLGQMAKVIGDLNLAEKHLKRGLQVVPDHPELARELKYLRR